jgi:hypothetical protein
VSGNNGHKFRWNTDLSGRGVCKLCDLKTKIAIRGGPKGGAIQVFKSRLHNEWMKKAPKCPGST